MKTTHTSITGLAGGVETEHGGEGRFRMEGNISTAIEEVKKAKEVGRNKKSHYQHMCTLPPIIVMELLTKHNLDIMHEEFTKTPAEMNRLKYLLRTEYPDLLVMT